MKRKLIIIPLICLMLSGCNMMKNDSETFNLHGKTAWTMDNFYVHAPKGYFINAYEWVEIDDHTMQLIFTLTDNKEYGEK